MKKAAAKIFKWLGYSIIKNKAVRDQTPDIREDEFWDIYNLCSPFTMTSVERMYSVYNAVIYVLNNNIPGDFVECGVWRGGISMIIARILRNRNISDRKIYLYDTFEGMSEPTSNDFDITGRNAAHLLKESDTDKETSVWCLADLADVKANMTLTELPSDHIIYVKGKVEDTIPQNIPAGQIALLRLDTDWYESTRHELVHLYPKLAINGPLIIDDYGHWEGCRKAVDEYFAEHSIHMLLSRIDYTGRLGIKSHTGN